MDIKIQCPCGQKISFDVEPENGAMPCELPCPACSADVTSLANENIRQQLAAAAPAPAPALASVSAPPPGPVTSVAPPAPPVPGDAPRMRISLAPTAHAPAVAAAEPAPAAEAPAAAPAPAAPSRGGRVKPVEAPAPAKGPARGADGEASVGVFLMGCVGVFGGAIVGMILWLLVAKMGLNLRIVAVLVGVGAGFGARVFCREGDKSLGGVAAVVAVLGMFMGGPLILDQKLRIRDSDLREAYAEAVKDSKTLVAEIPNGTDAEITQHLAKEMGGAGAVTAEDVREFRSSDEFKEARGLASGTTTFEKWSADIRKLEDKVHKDAGGAIAGLGAVRMLSLWLIGLVGGTAYKIAAG